ncbi:MAG: AAA family ATPase, partial [Deltaproteobacteria bacterium]|nr:AAA family ATPase [Deltaproteobacteria bacterium]
MYQDFFGLDGEPFHITPDPRFFFLSPSHRESLAAIAYGVKNRKGFIAVTGEVGTGKTTVVRTFLEKYGGPGMKTVLVYNANITFANLLEIIFAELDLEPEANDQFRRVQQLHRHLIDLYGRGQTVVLIIDEAQNMPVRTLENLRMLSNLETTRDKLLQIILVGQPELDSLLERRELRQLKQRLAVRTRLAPLTPAESLQYIRFRLQKAGGTLKGTFTKGALKKIIEYAGGIPR